MRRASPNRLPPGVSSGSILASIFLALILLISAAPAVRADSTSLDEVRRRKEDAASSMGTGTGPGTGSLSPGPPVQTGDPPQWIDFSPASDDLWHYGVGRAGRNEEQYADLARERSLADIAGKIVVTVRRETTDYAGFSRKGKKTITEQKVEETVKTSTDARLQDPEIVARYQDNRYYYVLMRVSALTPLQKELRSWREKLGVPAVTAGDFLDQRGIRTGFGDYLRDHVLSVGAAGPGAATPGSALPEASGRYVLLTDSISITVRVNYPDGRGGSVATFRIPAEPDHIAMMANRRDHSLVNAVPRQRWGGGRLSLGGELFREGDEIVIRFTPEVNCYVHIFNIVEDGTVTLLLPNRFRTDNFIKAGASLTFPGPLEREEGLILRAHLPRSSVSTRESVKVVGTRRPVSMGPGNFSEAVVEEYEADSEGIRRLLATLEDLDDRGVSWFEEVQYFVIGAK